MLSILRVGSALEAAGAKIASRISDVPTVNIDGHANPEQIREWLREWRRRVQTIQSDFEKLDWDKTVIQAFEIGTEVITLRKKIIDEFAQKSLGINIEDYEEAAVATLRERLASKVADAYEQIIKIMESEELKELVVHEATAELVGASVPFLKLARAVKELHDKATEIAYPYMPKGPIDELFNFVDAIDGSNQFARQQIAAMNAQALFFEAKLQ